MAAVTKKLLSLKQWLTLADAAKHLSILFNEEVSEADVLRLGLDGHLTLSVNFVNHAKGRMGQVVPIEKAKMYVFPVGSLSELPNKFMKDVLLSDIETLPDEVREGLENGSLKLFPMGDVFDQHNVIQYPDDNIYTLKDVWDLPMIGGEQLDIEHHYQQITGGPEVTLTCLDGAFVRSESGKYASIMESYDNNEYCPGSVAQLEQIKKYIDEKKIKDEKANVLLDMHKKDREKLKEKWKTEAKAEQYYPARGLPSDAVLVVRTSALRDFEASLSEGSTDEGKPLSANERNSLLMTIAALCRKSGIDLEERGAAAQLSRLTEKIGAPVSDDTMRRAISKIHDAVESRMK